MDVLYFIFLCLSFWMNLHPGKYGSFGLHREVVNVLLVYRTELSVEFRFVRIYLILFARVEDAVFP